MKTNFDPHATFSSIMVAAKWRCTWSRELTTDQGQPFCRIEYWHGPVPGQQMLAQVWPDNNGVTTYFKDGGETWTDLERRVKP